MSQSEQEAVHTYTHHLSLSLSPSPSASPSVCLCVCAAVVLLSSIASIQQSPFIVQLLEVLSNPLDGTLSICLELLDGGSLQDLVRAGGCRDEARLASIGEGPSPSPSLSLPPSPLPHTNILFLIHAIPCHAHAIAPPRPAAFQMTAGLQFLHGLRVMHRDLKVSHQHVYALTNKRELYPRNESYTLHLTY